MNSKFLISVSRENTEAEAGAAAAAASDMVVVDVAVIAGRRREVIVRLMAMVVLSPAENLDLQAPRDLHPNLGPELQNSEAHSLIREQDAPLPFLMPLGNCLRFSTNIALHKMLPEASQSETLVSHRSCGRAGVGVGLRCLQSQAGKMGGNECMSVCGLNVGLLLFQVPSRLRTREFMALRVLTTLWGACRR